MTEENQPDEIAGPPPLPEGAVEVGLGEPVWSPPPLPPRAYPGIAQTLLLLLLLFGVQIVFGVILVFAAGGIGADTKEVLKRESSLWILGLGNLVAFAAALAAGLPQVREGWRERMWLGPFPAGLLGPFLACAAGGLSLGLGGSLILMALVKNTRFKDLWSTDILPKGGVIPTLLLLCVVAPVTEELFFRGLVLGGFLKRYSERKALVASSALFSALHMSLPQLVPTFVIGLLFGWWRIKTKGLLVPLLAHAVHNGLAGAMILASRARGSTAASTADTTIPQLLGGAVFFLGLGLFTLLPGLSRARLVLDEVRPSPASDQIEGA